MSPSEILWRLRSEFRDLLDWHRFKLGRFPTFNEAVSDFASKNFKQGFRVSDINPGDWITSTVKEDEASWYLRLIEQGDKIVAHRFSFFDLKEKDLGDPIDWNRDYSSGKNAPLTFAPYIDYRDINVAGDCKLVWEPNRHHQLVVLGRAYRASGKKKYAEAVMDQIESWLDQCPYGIGMNWRSPMELAIRVINWVWAIDLIIESGVFAGALRTRILNAVYLHLFEITRKYSQGSSANNHLIGEAAGVFIATAYFCDMPNAERWKDQSKDILEREILAQTYPDGCGREQAIGYLLFDLYFFIMAGQTARILGEDLSADYWIRLEKMMEFIGILSQGGKNLPMVGDSDDGYVLDLGWVPGDARGLLSICAALFERDDFKKWAGGYKEPVRWLLGDLSRKDFDMIQKTGQNDLLKCHEFKDSGYYLLQSGSKESSESISVLFDCGRLGFKSIAGHGHADALSFVLRAFGTDIFVDPGTYDYFTYPDWRNYFRSTRAHNTLVVDEADQSEMSGSFMWGTKAQARCIQWELGENGGTVGGEHNGYSRLEDPVVHRRMLELDGKKMTVKIRDDIICKGSHHVAFYFHLSEICSPPEMQSNICEAAVEGRTVKIEIDPRLSVEMLAGSEDPIGGWVSRGYHQKTPSTTIVCRGNIQGDDNFEFRIKIR